MLRADEPKSGALVRVTDTGFGSYRLLAAHGGWAFRRATCAGGPGPGRPESVATAAADPANQVGPSPTTSWAWRFPTRPAAGFGNWLPGRSRRSGPRHRCVEGLYFQSVVSRTRHLQRTVRARFRPALDPPWLRHALTALMADHPSLRGGFTHEGCPHRSSTSSTGCRHR